MLLPRGKKCEILQLVKDADEMAARGKVRSGFSLLFSGLLYATADQESGESWAEDLIQAYDQAMDCYAERHELCPGARSAAPRPCPASS